MLRRLALVLVSALFFAACGTATEGGQCDSNGFLCLDATAALECRLGAWKKLPCRGPNGCKREQDVIRCDMTGNQENDACASTAEGRGICTADKLGTLECRSGILVKTNTCRACDVSGDQVVCQP
jgi:hypothetical protein